MSDSYHTLMESPVGRLFLSGDEQELRALLFCGGGKGVPSPRKGTSSEAPFREVMRQLKAYFGKELKTFDLPLNPRGTPFQQAVWQELRKIPYGETISYKELAGRMGKPTACRAVAAANARNPISIIIPCHRVIGSDGSLTGYGGGLEAKQHLLEIEGVLLRC